MSAGGDGTESGRREVAYRLFAAVFDDADREYSESDEERAPNYVITPTGGRVNRAFAVGVLTAVQPTGSDILRARIADPTGTFVVYAGQYQPDAQTFLERAEPPAYVAVTGKARTFQPEDSDVVYTSIRPESLTEVDEENRDRWTVDAARQTLDRVGTMATAMEMDERGDDLAAALREQGVPDGLAAGIPLALEHYGTTPGYLAAVREMAIQATELVADERDEVEELALAPDEGGDADLAALATTADIEAGVTGDRDGNSDGEASIGTGGPEPSTETVSSPDSESADFAEGDTGETTADGQSGEGEGAETPGADSQTGQRDEVDGTLDSDTTEEPTGDTTTEEPTGDTTIEEPEGDEAVTADADTVVAGGDEERAAASGDEEQAAQPGEFDGEFELDDEEREEIKSEFGAEFTSGTEVEEPGEAGIETPEPPEDAATDESGADEVAPAASDVDDENTPETAETTGADGEEGVDLEDAVMDAMTQLDDGDGADRATVIERVADDRGVEPGAVEDAVQEALMNGRCYEPDEGTLKPI